jgi:antitoxin component YwqK of YwqJK toxin-antitoxin module
MSSLIKLVIIEIIIQLLSTQLIFSQLIVDTSYTSKMDSMILTYKNNKDQVKFEEYYFENKLIYYKIWFYKRKYLGYNLVYGDDPINGKIIKRIYDLDRKKILEKSTLKGVLDGPLREYYSNGQLKSECYYKKGRMDSITRIYFDNGQLWTELFFKNNRCKEVLSNYDRNGKKMQKGDVMNGNGVRNVYDNKGNLIYLEHFRKGYLMRRSKIRI